MKHLTRHFKWLLVPVVAASSIVLGTAGSAMATPNGPLQNQQSFNYVNGNGHDQLVTMDVFQPPFKQVNCQYSTILRVRWYTCEWQDTTTGLCLDVNGAEVVLEESCPVGDTSELMINPYTGGPGGAVWIINVYWSNHENQYQYMTEGGSELGSYVIFRGPGYGAAAVWVT